MSLSKRILFGDDPADDRARQQLAKKTRQYLEPFKFKIPTRRRNRLRIGPHWDPIWPARFRRSAKELDVETVQINSHVCTKTQAEADAVLARAKKLHQARWNELNASVNYGTN